MFTRQISRTSRLGLSEEIHRKNWIKNVGSCMRKIINFDLERFVYSKILRDLMKF